MSSKLHYSSYGNTVDGTSFCSGVETLAENLVEDNENDAVITFPSKDSWASLRSTSYRMTDENAEAVLPLPIYKIKKVLLKPVKLLIITSLRSTTPGGVDYKEKNIEYSEYKNSNGEYLEYFDITDCIVTANEWQSLPLAVEREEYLQNTMKDNTFFWEDGAEKIPFLATIYKIKGDFFQSIFGGDNVEPVWERLIRKKLYAYKDTHFYEYEDDGETLRAMLDASRDRFLSDGVSVLDWQFRIEYVPVTSATKMRARKNAKTNVEYIQPFNQRAEINAASAFGRNMYLTAQKTGVKEIVLAKWYTRLADIPPLGARVRHNGKTYRLVANHYEMTSTTHIKVMHTLSENWTMKSKHVAVDQKYRNWKIPQDMLWRNLYWEEYVHVSFDAPLTASGSVDIKEIVKIFQADISTDATIDSFFWYPDDRSNGMTLPCSTYAVGNSMVFSASFKDNLSAGLTRNDDLCEEALYCNSDGTLTSARVVLSDGIGNLSDDAYPKATKSDTNYPLDTLFSNTFYIDKDAGEALKFTYQIHFIADDPDIVIGRALSEQNTLVKRWASNRDTFFMEFFKTPVRDCDDSKDNNIIGAWIQGYQGMGFDLTFDASGQWAKISLNAVALEELSKEEYVAWGISDGDFNLLIGCNDKTKTEIYFSISRSR